MKLAILGILGALAGCSVEPAPLLVLPPGHPGSPDSPETAYEAPPNLLATAPEAPAAELCPVSGLKLGSMGPIAELVHEGRTIRFCCPACLPKFKADPVRPLKPAAPGHEHHGGHP